MHRGCILCCGLMQMVRGMKDYEVPFKRLLTQPLFGWGRNRITHVPPTESLQTPPPASPEITYHSHAETERKPATTSQQTMRTAFHKSSVSFSPPGATQQNILGKSETPRVQFGKAESSMGAVIAQGRGGFAVKYHIAPAEDAEAKPTIEKAGLAEKSQQPFLNSLLVRLRGAQSARNTSHTR